MRKSCLLLLILSLINFIACSKSGSGGSGSGGNPGKEPPISTPAQTNQYCLTQEMTKIVFKKYLDTAMEKVSQSLKNEKSCNTDKLLKMAGLYFTQSLDQFSVEKKEKWIRSPGFYQLITKVFDHNRCEVRNIDQSELENLRKCK